MAHELAHIVQQNKTNRISAKIIQRDRDPFLTKTGSLSNPFLFIRPTKVAWHKWIATIQEYSPQKYKAGVGCIPGGKILMFSIEGKAMIRSRDTGQEVIYNRASHKVNFPGQPFLSDVYTYTKVHYDPDITYSTTEVPKLSKEGSFNQEYNIIKFEKPLRRLTLYLRLRNPAMTESKGSDLILESIQGPNDLISVCEWALAAEFAAEEASKRAKMSAKGIEKMQPYEQPIRIDVAAGELNRINYYFSAVGLAMDAKGFIHLVSAWTSPDRWRWYSRNKICDYAASGHAQAFKWTAEFVRNWLKKDREYYYRKEPLPLPFLVFIGELRRFENDNPKMTMDEEIRAIRRAHHEKSLPFDHVIGVPPGQPEEYSMGEIGGPLQFVKDHNSVLVNGREIDIAHIAVGLEALPLDRPDVELEIPIKIATYEMPTEMESAAAATWAGDIGSVLADWFCGVDKKNEWKGDMEMKLDYYWKMRAFPKDLDSDIAAWGIHRERKAFPSKLRRFSDVLLHHFSGVSAQENRRMAFREFTQYYSTPGAKRIDIQRIRKQIFEFGRVWTLKRIKEGYSFRYTMHEFNWAADELTSRFVLYVESQM